MRTSARWVSLTSCMSWTAQDLRGWGGGKGRLQPPWHNSNLQFPLACQVLLLGRYSDSASRRRAIAAGFLAPTSKLNHLTHGQIQIGIHLARRLHAPGKPAQQDPNQGIRQLPEARRSARL